jgi:hypothetical protein
MKILPVVIDEELWEWMKTNLKETEMLDWIRTALKNHRQTEELSTSAMYELRTGEKR